MPPILSFIGYSESGKTTLLEGVIAELKRRGYKTAAIKHAHETFEIEKQDSSSWHLGQAGAVAVAVSSPQEFAVFRKTDLELTPQEISRYIEEDYDLLLTEGFKQSSNMKVEVHRKEQGNRLLALPDELLALVSDELLDIDKPQFKRDDVKGLTDLIEKWLLEQPKEKVELTVNGVSIPLNQFATDIIAKTLTGMASSLKGVNEIYSLRVSLRRKL